VQHFLARFFCALKSMGFMLLVWSQT